MRSDVLVLPIRIFFHKFNVITHFLYLPSKPITKFSNISTFHIRKKRYKHTTGTNLDLIQYLDLIKCHVMSMAFKDLPVFLSKRPGYTVGV